MAKKAKSALDPTAFLATIKSDGRTVSDYRKEDVVFLQASPADAVFYIQKGKIKIVVTSPYGKEAVVAVLGAADFFGEGCLIHQPQRLATARAMSESKVMRVEKAAMIRALRIAPTFAALFRTHLLTRNNRAEADLVDQLFNSSEKRLARALLLLANIDKVDGPWSITTRINHETLAEIIGATRPRVSVFMSKFRKLGFIDYSSRPDDAYVEVHASLLSVVLGDETGGKGASACALLPAITARGS